MKKLESLKNSMKKKIFKWFDVSLLLIIFAFGYIALTEDSIQVRIISFILALTTLISIISSIYDRLELKKIAIMQNEADKKALEEMAKKDQITVNTWKGRSLELALIEKLRGLYPDALIFDNVLVPKNNNNETTQIDILGIIDRRIYVFECKKYLSEIIKSDNSDEIKGYNNISLSDPFKQNKFHISKLSEYMLEGNHYYGNIVVYSDQTKIDFNDFKDRMDDRTRLSRVKNIKSNIDYIKKYITQIDIDNHNEIREILLEFGNKFKNGGKE